MTRSEIVHDSQAKEIQIGTWLRSKIPNGDLRLMPYASPFDAVCSGKRIEFKTANYSRNQWIFNLHRHGRLDESKTDIYVLQLNNVPGFKAAIYLIVPAPLERPTVIISLRSLLTRWSKFFERLDLIDPLWEKHVRKKFGPLKREANRGRDIEAQKAKLRERHVSDLNRLEQHFSAADQIKQLFCLRCSHKWYPRNRKTPMLCPDCHGPWNEGYKRKSWRRKTA